MRQMSASIFSIAIVTALSSNLASAANLYVATNGSDASTNPGTDPRTPLLTIIRASLLAQPGDVVNVAPGTYKGGFKIDKSGRADARITYKSSAKGKAKIVPTSGNPTLWDHRGSYTNIIGFNFDGGTNIDGSLNTTARTGLYVGGSYNLIQDNYVHHLAQKTVCTDTGASAIGSDSYYYGVKNDVISNVVHHIGPAGCTFDQGIYISTSGTVKNNVVYNVSGAAIHLWHDANDVDIVNNTVTSSTTGIVVGGGNFYHSTNLKADDIKVYNNIVYDNNLGISEQGTTGASNSYLNNLVFQNAQNWDLDPGKSYAGTVTADPQFVNYNRTGASVDLHLKSTSPAINKGLSTLAPSTDLDGVARPQNSYFDIGAYEYKSTVTVPMTVTPASLTFTTQAVGTPSAAKIITIKNTGTTNMTFPGSFVFTGDFDFGNAGSAPCQVGTVYAPGTSCTASVAFRPTATGTRTGTLKITSNVSSMTVSLSGTGM